MLIITITIDVAKSITYMLTGVAMRLIPTLVIMFIGLMPLYGIGLALAGVVVRLRDVNALMNVVTALLSVLSGATYPIYILPKWVDAVVVALPMYQMYQTALGIVMGSGVTGLIYGLAASTVAYLALGVFTYGRVERDMLKGGVK